MVMDYYCNVLCSPVLRNHVRELLFNEDIPKMINNYFCKETFAMQYT